MATPDNDAIEVITLQDDASRTQHVRNELIVFIGLFIVVIINIAGFYNDIWLPEVWGAIAFLIFLTFFVSGDTTNVVMGMAAWTATIVTSFLAWRYDGLYDASLIIYPFILMFSSVLCGRALLIPLILYMLITFYFFAYAATNGLMENITYSTDKLWIRASYMAIILAVYCLGIAKLSLYIKSLARNVFRERRIAENIKRDADRQILYDGLTGLPNEEKCKQSFKDILSEREHDGGIIGFLSLNLDNFNWINSSLGHDIGDKALLILAERFHKLIDDHTHIYRKSGLEFILLKYAQDYEELTDFCHQLLGGTFRSIDIAEYDIEVSCSLGVSIAPFDGNTFQELLQKSNTALYKAKEEESNSLRFFEAEMEAQASRRLTLVHALKQAADKHEFELYYQPKVDLETNYIVGAEALIRWRRSNGELVSPAEFIPTAEESGIINEIGKWVLETACVDCASWHLSGFPSLGVAVNLSPIQFKRGNLPNQVLRALHKANMDPSLLELEITESLFIDDDEHVKNQIYTMSEKGINFAIDDFGTGYSNLNYLAKFNASTLKIDMSFVRDMMNSDQHLHIVNAIIKMSSVMELENVAEGVEDASAAEKLKQLGCTYGQGYYWSRPVPKEEFLALVRKNLPNARSPLAQKKP